MARRGQDDVYTHSSCPYLDGTRPLNTGLGSVISVLFMLRCIFALETKTASKRHCAATGLAMEIIHRGLREHSNALAGTIGQPARDTGCSPPLHPPSKLSRYRCRNMRHASELGAANRTVN